MKKGVTLIELMTVIALIAVLSIILIPASSGIRNMCENKSFEGIAKGTLEDMRYAKIRALTKGPVMMHITSDGYTLTDSYSKQIYKRVIFKKGIYIDILNSTTPSDGRLYFRDSGSVSPYACSLIIKDDDGNSSTISIKVSTFTIDFKKR